MMSKSVLDFHSLAVVEERHAPGPEENTGLHDQEHAPKLRSLQPPSQPCD
jgi:hypothetical protein